MRLFRQRRAEELFVALEDGRVLVRKAQRHAAVDVVERGSAFRGHFHAVVDGLPAAADAANGPARQPASPPGRSLDVSPADADSPPGLTGRPAGSLVMSACARTTQPTARLTTQPTTQRKSLRQGVCGMLTTQNATRAAAQPAAHFYIKNKKINFGRAPMLRVRCSRVCTALKKRQRGSNPAPTRGLRPLPFFIPPGSIGGGGNMAAHLKAHRPGWRRTSSVSAKMCAYVQKSAQKFGGLAENV